MPSLESSDLPRAATNKAILRTAARREPNSIAKLVESIEQDYQFKLGYLVIESLVKSAPVLIEVEQIPESVDRSGVDALAGNLRESWTQALPSAIRSFAYGRAAFEKTYRFDAATGLYLVADLDYLPPEYTKLVLDDQGSFCGIKLEVGDDSILLDAPRSWWFALDPTATEPHGRSRYLGAPLDVWKARRQLDEQERIWYSKFAIGHGIARAPDRMESTPPYQAGSQLSNTNGETNDPMEVLRRELTAIESGGILILSSRTYPDGTPLYDYTESEGQRDRETAARSKNDVRCSTWRHFVLLESQKEPSRRTTRVARGQWPRSISRSSIARVRGSWTNSSQAFSNMSSER